MFTKSFFGISVDYYKKGRQDVIAMWNDGDRSFCFQRYRDQNLNRYQYRAYWDGVLVYWKGLDRKFKSSHLTMSMEGTIHYVVSYFDDIEKQEFLDEIPEVPSYPTPREKVSGVNSVEVKVFNLQYAEAYWRNGSIEYALRVWYPDEHEDEGFCCLVADGTVNGQVGYYNEDEGWEWCLPPRERNFVMAAMLRAKIALDEWRDEYSRTKGDN